MPLRIAGRTTYPLNVQRTRLRPTRLVPDTLMSSWTGGGNIPGSSKFDTRARARSMEPDRASWRCGRLDARVLSSMLIGCLADSKLDKLAKVVASGIQRSVHRHSRMCCDRECE